MGVLEGKGREYGGGGGVGGGRVGILEGKGWGGSGEGGGVGEGSVGEVEGKGEGMWGRIQRMERKCEERAVGGDKEVIMWERRNGNGRRGGRG